MYLHPLTASLPAAERASFARLCRLSHFKRNQTVLEAGASTDQLYCVATGLLRVVTPECGDRPEVTSEFIRPDGFFDLPVREDRYRAEQSLVAVLPSSVYLVPVAAMRELCARHPEVAMALLGLVVSRMGMLSGQMRRVSTLPSEERVHRVLHQLTQLAPVREGGYDKRISQSMIASYSGLSREVVNKTMRDMEQRGLLRRDAHAVHVMHTFARAA
ncbi:Crp/Fnr family transcriptional regulator [Variovorax atrisoli]|uniref:Crp/Fnr family transcriptional regulator n=1 Tax=Variovorax atrisoli TaxID=3394203 RepID=UPI0033971E54